MDTLKSLIQQPRSWLEWKPQRNLQIVLISLVLLASGYVAYLLATTNPLSQVVKNPLLLALVGGIVVVFLLISPRAGYVVLIPAMILVKFQVGTGSETRIALPILLFGLLIGLWILDMVVRPDLHRVFPSSTLASSLAFLLAGCVALGVGQLPWFDFSQHAPFRAQVGELGIYTISIGGFLWAGNRAKDASTLELATRLFFIAGAIAILGDLFSPLGRFTSSIVNQSAKGSLFWTWLVGLAFGQLALNRSLPRGWRIGLIGLLAAVIYIGVILNRSWTSGWLPALVGAAVIVWLAFPRLRVPMVLFGLLLAIFFSQNILAAVMVGDNQYSLSTRLPAWQIILTLLQADPIFGLGLANYYWYTPLIPILGYRVVFNSHNNYMDLLAQTGLVGTVCFIWFAAAVLRLAYRLRNRFQDGFSRAFLYGVMGAWVGTLVAGMFGDWMLPFVYNIGYAGLPASLIGWFFLGGLLFYERLDRRIALHETPPKTA